MYATLLDEGTYLASVATMYGLLREHGETGDRRPAPARHPPRSGQARAGRHCPPGYQHEQVVFQDDTHIAFLDGYPTLYGKVLVAPKAHIEHVIADLSHEAFLELMVVVHRVGRAVERVVPWERTYLLSLGSQQANAHLHWHIAPLPPGVPFQRQQFHALTLDNGVIP